MTRKPDLFLENLAGDIQPVSNSSLLRRYALWSLLITIIVGVVSTLITRPGLAVRLEQPDFVLQFGLWLAVVLVAGGSAFVLATPRWPMASGVGLALCGLLAALAGFGAWLVMRLPIGVSTQANTSEIACMAIVSGIGLLTALCTIFALKGRARPTYPLLMGFMMAIAGAGTGMLAIMLVCPHEGAAHVLVSHFLPALLIGLLMAFVGKKWWRW